jgi:hypothetical protein
LKTFEEKSTTKVEQLRNSMAFERSSPLDETKNDVPFYAKLMEDSR